MEEQATNKYDSVAAEQRYQEKLLQIKNILARYTTEADKGNFYKRNEKAIEGLARGNSVSDVMTGFSSLANPNKTYDARVELQYFMNSESKWAFSPRFHFKRETLFISPTITLPTSARHEYCFSLNECRQNKLEATANIGGEMVKIELNESELTELSNTRQLSRVIKSSDESTYEYRINANLDANRRSIERLVVVQHEKIRLPEEDIQKLAQTGHLDKPLVVGEGVNQRQYFVAVDKELNKLAFAPASAFNSLNKIQVVNLSPLDIRNLLTGQQVTTTMMYGKDAGLQATVRLDPVKKNLKIETAETPAQKQAQAQKVAQKATISPALRAATKKMAETQKTPAVKRQKMGV